MNILFISLYPFFANNSGMMRNRALVKGLVDNGHKVDVITIENNKLQKTTSCKDIGINNIYYAGRNQLYDSITGQKKQKGTTLKKILERIIRVLYHKFYPFDYTMRIAKRINIRLIGDRKYDMIISSSNPWSSHEAVKRLIKQGLQYKSWIEYWGDPLSNNVSNKCILPDIVLQKYEKKLFSISDKIVFVSPLTFEYEKKVHKTYISKFAYLPIPFDEPKFYYGNKYVGYYGDYYSKSRNIYPFYNAVNELKVPTVIVGSSNLKLHSTEYVEIYDRGDVSHFMEKTMLLIVVLNKRGTQIPGKIFHYSGTNIKTLVICDGNNSNAIRKYFEKYNKRFFFCDNNKNDIKKALTTILQNNCPADPIMEFSGKVISNEMIGLVKV